MNSLDTVGNTVSLPCSEGPGPNPPVPRKSSSYPPTLFLFHPRLDLLCGGVKFSSSENISHPRHIATVFGQLSGIRLYDKRADGKWQPIFVTYEVCPESIRPFEYLENRSRGLHITWQPVSIREQSLSRGASQSAVRRR